MHHINHDNYETWLMLYLDNELTAADRAAVEAFAAAHPEVQAMLDGLKNTLLLPEAPLPMPGKAQLIMPETWDEPAPGSLQEKLLLLADKALPASEAAALQEEMEQDRALATEWQLLRHTVLTAEAPALMPGKEKLFRRERGMVIGLRGYFSMAAAAAVLAFGWFAISRMAQPALPAEAEMAGTATTTGTAAQNGNNATTAATMGAVNTTPQTGTIEQQGAETAPTQTALLLAGNAPQKKQSPEAGQQVTENRMAPAYAAVTETTPDAAKMLTAKIATVTVIEVPGIDQPNALPVNTLPVIETVQVSPATEIQPSEARFIDASALEDDATINIGGARINKQKIRGIYRSITRPLARSMDRSVASIAVK